MVAKLYTGTDIEDLGLISINLTIIQEKHLPWQGDDFEKEVS